MIAQILQAIFTLVILTGIGVLLLKKLHRLNDVLERVAKGDLTQKLSLKPQEIFRKLYLNINTLILSIRGFINETTIMTDKLIYIDKQGTYMVQTEDLVDEMIQEHLEIVENGKRIETLAISMDEKIKGTNEVYENLVHKLNQSAEANKLLAIKSTQLSKKAYKIETIVDTVNQISDNTKLLAFNASIEAARAGENGAGFSVIAQEIQKLADLSSIQSKEIQNIISDIKAGITDIAASMNQEVEVINSTISFSSSAEEHLGEITSANKETLRAVENINGIIKTQSKKIDGIKQIVQDVNLITQEINKDVETMNTAAQEQLATVINVFDAVSNLTDLNKGLKGNIDAFIKNYVINTETKEYIAKGLQTLIDLSEEPVLETMEWSACTKLLKQKVSENPYFELFGLIDKKGLRKAITLDYSEQEVLTSFVHRTYYKEAVKGEKFESKPYISVDTNNYCIAIAVPVRNQIGLVAGVLMGDLILG